MKTFTSKSFGVTLLFVSFLCVQGIRAADTPKIKGPLSAGDKKVQVEVNKAATRAEIKVEDASGKLVSSKVDTFGPDDSRHEFELSDPLKEGHVVRVRQFINPNYGDWSDPVFVGSANTTDQPFQASVFLGTAVDTFASTSLQKLLNQDNNTTDPKVRGVFGFDFAYRLTNRERNLWVYGETLHGVRSADVDCEAHPNFQVCSDNFELDPNTGNVLKEGVFILRNATSIEAFTGLRWDFHPLNGGSSSPASLYVKGQVGFLAVKGTPDDLVDSHHIGFGAIVTSGEFEDSYFEVGFGKTDLFIDHPDRRFKVDAHLSRALGGGVYFFAQMTVDSDLGNGSDSVQTYFGLDFDLGNIFRK